MAAEATEQGLEPEHPLKQALRGGTLKGSQELQDTDPICCTALASPKGQRVVCGKCTGEQKSVCVCVCRYPEGSRGVFPKGLFVTGLFNTRISN